MNDRSSITSHDPFLNSPRLLDIDKRLLEQVFKVILIHRRGNIKDIHIGEHL